MGAESLNNGIDLYKAKYERLNRVFPPKYAPGQELKSEPISTKDLLSDGVEITNNSEVEFDEEWFEDPFEKNKEQTTYESVFGRPAANNALNPYGFNTGNVYGASWNGMVQQPYKYQQYQGLTYEKTEELVVKAGKGLWSIISSMSKTTPLFWYRYCGRLMIMGLVMIAISVLFYALDIGKPFEIFISGIILSVGSLGTAMLLKETATRYTDEYKEVPVQDATPANAPMADEKVKTPSLSNLRVERLDDLSDEDDDNEDCEIEDDFDLDDLEIELPIKKENPNEVLKSMQEIPKGMYTRKYLYDTFTRLLPNICPEYGTLREITTEERAFFEMEAAVKEAAEVTGCKEEIEVLKLYENYATIIVTTTRPTGLKLDVVASELSNIYAHRSSDITEAGRSRVYAKAEAVGKTCIFTIFTGKTEMISLKDMYKQVEDYILDAKNYLPVVFGIDPMAKVIVYDLKNLESIIIAGMPRSGKSWFAQSIITQMAAFTSPRELQFYICDPKGEISDFKPFCLPHVKSFVTNDTEIMRTLNWLVKKEAPRRKKIIGAGDNLTSFQNVWDYKSHYPDADMPIIYIVIDEVVTLASRMEKDTFSDFRAMLRELVSQLPALGIRAIMIPHVLKNDIIEKKTSDLVLCRVSVCGNAEHVESVTGVKTKDFPFHLSMPGDMAVCMPPVSQRVMYLRAPVLTATNGENRELFDYMRQVWNKLEPSSVSGSVAESVAKDNVEAEYKLNEDDIADLDIFDAGDSNKISREFRRVIGAL